MVAPVPDLLVLFDMDGRENVVFELSTATTAIPTDASLILG